MSELSEGWVGTTLSEIAEVVDCEHKTAPKVEQSEYYSIRTTDIKGGKIDLSIANRVSFETYSNWIRRATPEAGDIILAREAPVGEVGWIKEGCNVCLGQRTVLIKVTSNKVSKKYLLYHLVSPSSKYELRVRATGSVVPHLNMKDIRAFQLLLPPLPEQKAIADMLSSFDEKIELLREQNKTLETLAQTIFKEWFVNFNYPDATGDMVESELGLIPKGWRVYALNELVDTVNGYSYKGKELVESSDEALVTLKSFNRNGGFQTRGFKPFSGTPKLQQEVLIGDLVVAHTDLTQDADVLGNPAFVFEDGGFNKMFITMDLVKVNSKVEHIDNAFLYYVMKDRRFKGHCIGYANGTTVLHLSKKAIPEYTISLPENLKLARGFSDMAYSMTRKISNNIKHLQKLEKARGTLLPKLMNGQVRLTKPTKEELHYDS